MLLHASLASTKAAGCITATVVLPGGDKVKVGICHNVWWLEPKHGGPFYLHVKCATDSTNPILLFSYALAACVIMGESVV